MVPAKETKEMLYRLFGENFISLTVSRTCVAFEKCFDIHEKLDMHCGNSVMFRWNYFRIVP